MLAHRCLLKNTLFMVLFFNNGNVKSYLLRHSVLVMDIEKLILDKEIDFLDFGSSYGGSIALGKKWFEGRRGLGIDIDKKKVESAIENGYEAIDYNLLLLPDKPLVDFVIMSHFLEHIDDRKDLYNIIRKACVVSKKFVYIQQPFFDADGYLFSNGLKLFWSDWTGHPNRMTSLEMSISLRNLKNQQLINGYRFFGRKQILDSSDIAVHPISSEHNQHFYDEKIHGIKDSNVIFKIPIFHEFLALIYHEDCEPDELEQKFKHDYKFNLLD